MAGGEVVIEIDEVQTIGAEMLVEYRRIEGVRSTGDQAEDFRRVTRLLGIAALKALPNPTAEHLALLRQALGDAA